MCYEGGIVMLNLYTIVWRRQYEWVHLMFFLVSGEGTPLVELLHTNFGAEIGSSHGMSYGNRDGKLEVYPLVE